MRKVRNRKCIAHISTQSMLANKKRCVILLVAIALATMMLTSLFTIGGSMVKSIEMSTMYQVGTKSHGGFKFLTEEEYKKLAKDPEISNLSYNIIVGNVFNDELYEDYTELRYTTEECARDSFAMPTWGHLPEQESQIATCTKVLDDFGLPHELGQKIHLKMSNGIHEYEGDFTVCGIWEKPAETMANQIFVSKAFQEQFSPVWKNQEDKEYHEENASFAGSINPGFYFHSTFNISGQMDQLKERCDFRDDINDGVNWAYSTSSIDFKSVAIAGSLLVLIMLSGYLIIYNIFLIAVSSDIHYYGLLKTVGTTNKQLKRIVVRQGNMLSLIAIPIGLIAGYLISVILLPLITSTFTNISCQMYPSIWIFLLSAAFSWMTVRISCFKPCRVVKKVSPMEAMNYSDCIIRGKLKERKGHKVTPFTMAWENLKRSRTKNMVVILSIALSVVMVNVTLPDGSSKDYEVMAVGDISYAMGAEHSHGLDINITIPRDEYLKCIPDAKGAIKCSFNAKEDMRSDIDAKVSEYCEVTKPKLGYVSRELFLKDFRSMINMFLLVGGILSFIIALIGVLNLVNLTYTSINERSRELATLRAIGMTQKQMSNMIIGEGLIRIAITFAFVLTVGIAITYGLVHLIASQMIMFRYEFVIWPVLTSIPVLCAIVISVSKVVINV